MEVGERIFLLSPIGFAALGILTWFLLSREGWSRLFSKLLLWASVLCLCWYTSGFVLSLLDYDERIGGNFTESVASMMTLTGALFALLIPPAALVGGLISWVLNRKKSAPELPKREHLTAGLAVFVVLVFLALIVVSIAIPSFCKVRNNASQQACINNLRMIDSGKECAVLSNRWTDTAGVVTNGPFLPR